MAAAVEALIVELEARGSVVDGSAGRSVSKLGDEAVKTEGKTKRLKKSQDDLGGATGAVSKHLQNQVQQLVAMGAATLGVVAAFRAFASGVHIFSDFESQMAAVEAITRSTKSAMAEMTATARELGASTVFSASEAAAGMQFLGRAGWETSEIIAGMPGLLDLAAAGALELGNAADITSNIMSAFNLEAARSAEVADKLALAAASSNIDVQQLGDSMRYAGPIAAALGISLSETVATIGKLGDVGLGDIAGRGLRTTLSSLANVSKDADKALAALGLTAKDIDPEIFSLSEIFTTLREHNLGATEAFKIFGNEGASVALSLAANAEALKVFSNELDRADGTAREMAGTMNDTLMGSAEELGGMLEEIALDLVSQFSPALRSAADAIKTALDDNRGFFVAFGRLLGEVLSMATALFSFIAENAGTIAKALTAVGVAVALINFAPLIASSAVLNLTMKELAGWLLIIGDAAPIYAFTTAMDALSAATSRLTAAILANPILAGGAAAAAMLAIINSSINNWADQSVDDIARVIGISNQLRDSWERTAAAIESSSESIIQARQGEVRQSLANAEIQLNQTIQDLAFAKRQFEDRTGQDSSSGYGITDPKIKALTAQLEDQQAAFQALSVESLKLKSRQSELADVWGKSLPDALAALRAKAEEMGFGDIVAQIDAFAASLKAAPVGAGEAFNQLAESVQAAREQLNFMKEFGLTAGEAAQAAQALLSEDNAASRKAIVAQLLELRKLGKEMETVSNIDVFEKMLEDSIATTDSLRDLQDQYENGVLGLEDLAREQEILSEIQSSSIELTAAQVKQLREYLEAQFDAKDAIAAVTEEIEFQNKAFEDSKDAARSVENYVRALEEEAAQAAALSSIRREDFATEAAYQEVMQRVNVAREIRIKQLQLQAYWEAQAAAIMANGTIGEAERLRQLGDLNAEYAELAIRIGEATAAKAKFSNQKDTTDTKLEDWEKASRAIADAFDELDTGLANVAESAANLLGAFQEIGTQAGNINAAISTAEFAAALTSTINQDGNYAAEGGVVGAIVGAIIGAWIGGFAAEGAAIGGAAGTALGALIKKGTDEFLGNIQAVALGQVDSMTTLVEGSMNVVGAKYLDAIGRGIDAALAAIGGQLGGSGSDVLGGMSVKIRDGVFYIFYAGVEAKFDSMAEAVDYAILAALKNAPIVGISDEVRAALQNSTASSFAALGEDLTFARMVESLPKVGQAASESALAVSNAIDVYQQAIRKALQIGIETGKLDQALAVQLSGMRNSILGIEESIDQRIRREAEGFNREVQLAGAEAKLQEADLLIRQASLQAELDIVSAKQRLGEYHIATMADEARAYGGYLRIRSELVAAEASVYAAQINVYSDFIGVTFRVATELAAVTASLAAVQGIIAALPAIISEGEIRAAIGRARAAAGGGNYDTGADQDEATRERFLADLADAEAALSGAASYLRDFTLALEDIAAAAQDARDAGAEEADVLRYIAATQRLAALDLIRSFVDDMQISDLPALRSLRGFVQMLQGGVDYGGDMQANNLPPLIPQHMASQIEQATGADLSGLAPDEVMQALTLLGQDFPEVLQIINDAIAELEAQALSALEDRIGDLADGLDRVNLDNMLLAIDQLEQFGEIDADLLASLPEDIQALLLALGDGAVAAADVITAAIAQMVDDLNADLQSLRDSASSVGEFRIGLRDLGTQFADLRDRTREVYAGTGDLVSRLAELNRLEAHATRGLGIDFLGSLLDLGVETPRLAALQDQLRIAQLAMAHATAIADAMALHAAGAFDMLGMSLADMLDMIDEAFLLAMMAPTGGGGSSSSSASSSYSSAASSADALAAALAAVQAQTDQWLDSGLDPLQQTLNGMVDRFVDLRDALFAAGGTAADLIDLENALNFARQRAFDAVLDSVRDFLAVSERQDPGLRAPNQLEVLQSQFQAAMAEAMANPGQESIQTVLDLAGELQNFGAEFFTGSGLSGFLNEIDAQVAQLLDLQLPDAEIPPPQDVNVITAPTVTSSLDASAAYQQQSMLSLLEQNPLLAMMLGVNADQVNALSEVLGIGQEQLIQMIAANPMLGSILSGITEQIPLLMDALGITGDQLVAILSQNPLLADILTAQDGAIPLLGQQLLTLLEQKPLLGEQIAAMALAGDLTAEGLADLLAGVQTQNPLMSEMLIQMIDSLGELETQSDALGGQDQTLQELLSQAVSQNQVLVDQIDLLGIQNPILQSIAGNTGGTGSATSDLQSAQLYAANATLAAINSMAVSQIANADGLISSMGSLENRVGALTVAVGRLETAVDENTNSQAAGGT